MQGQIWAPPTLGFTGCIACSAAWGQAAVPPCAARRQLPAGGAGRSRSRLRAVAAVCPPSERLIRGAPADEHQVQLLLTHFRAVVGMVQHLKAALVNKWTYSMLASTVDADCLTHLHSSTTIHAYMTSHLALLCRSCDAWPGRLPKAMLGEMSTPGVLLPGGMPASGLPGDEPHAAASAEAGMHTDTCFRAVLSSMQCICLS